MAVGIDLEKFRAGFMAALDRQQERERTPEGRRALSAEYRAEAKRLRQASGQSLWSDAGGEMNTHVAGPAELARRARERADQLEKRAAELDAIKGIYNPWDFR